MHPVTSTWFTLAVCAHAPAGRVRTLRALLIVAAISSAACARSPVPDTLDPPAAAGASLPRLSSDAAGTAWLSWIEPQGEGHALKFASLGAQGWSTARTAAQGTGWFLNWADFPSVVHLGEGRLAAHWLRKLEGGPYAYEVQMSVSTDGGAAWSMPASPHGDGTATEHGFVALYAVPGGAGAAWLDGRNTAGGGHEDAHHGHGGEGAMTLRAGGLDWSGRPLPERELDGRVCDCCATAAATSAHGTTLVYRGRTEAEIRDIRAVTLGPGGWSDSAAVGTEGWEMPACPVNGPAIAGKGARLAASWFTAAQGRPRVLAAFSSDGGQHWTEPVEVSVHPPLGRVAIVMPSEDTAIVSWLEPVGDRAAIRYRQIVDGGRPGVAHTLATTSPARSSGFPQMALAGDRLVFAWTRAGEPTGIASASVPLP
jgi:hypothetical protein